MNRHRRKSRFSSFVSSKWRVFNRNKLKKTIFEMFFLMKIQRRICVSRSIEFVQLFRFEIFAFVRSLSSNAIDGILNQNFMLIRVLMIKKREIRYFLIDCEHFVFFYRCVSFIRAAFIMIAKLWKSINVMIFWIKRDDHEKKYVKKKIQKNEKSWFL